MTLLARRPLASLPRCWMLLVLAPPVLSFSQVVTELWPPDHRMRLVLESVHAHDERDGPVPVEVAVTSDEPVDGIGDGSTAPDWEVRIGLDGGVQLYLRAERNGGGEARVYTVVLTATDAAGNEASTTLEVRVPHDGPAPGVR